MRTDSEINRPDPEIACKAVDKLHDELPYSSQFIKVTVTDGWVTLDGELEWNYQRHRAATAVREVRGVTGVSDNTQLKPRVTASDVTRRIEDALKRSAELDGLSVHRERIAVL